MYYIMIYYIMMYYIPTYFILYISTYVYLTVEYSGQIQTLIIIC